MSGMDHIYSSITSADNLFASWAEFRAAKRSKADVTAFERHVEDNLFDLRADLTGWTYQHGPYEPFTITDPKPRSIHKASVRDRIVHHAIYRILYPIFNSRFIDDSYSCRFDKGTHRAVRRLESFTRKVSHNYTKPCWALKCDIRKFFDSVDHEILMRQLEERIACVETRWLLKGILDSYQSASPKLDLAGCQIERERERERVLWRCAPKGCQSAI